MEKNTRQEISLVLDYYAASKASTIRFIGFVRGLAALEAKVNVYCLIPDSNFSTFDEEIPNVTFHYLWNKKYPRIINWMQSTIKLLSLLKRGNDVVLFAHFAPFLLLLSFMKHLNVFWHVTEYPLLFPGNFIIDCTYQLFLRRCPKLAGIFVISQSLKEWFIDAKVAESKVHVLNMTVDCKRFANCVKQQHSNRIICYCGAVSIDKDGVDKLIQTFQSLAEKYADIELHIYGKFESEATATKLQALAQTSHSERIIFKGQVSPQDMVQALVNSDILTLIRPDNIQAKYGFPTKLGEYLLTKNPVVVTDVGEIGSFLKNKETAMIAIPDDINSAIDAFEFLLNNPQEMSKIGEAGEKVALENFNSLIESQKIIDILNK